MAGNEPSRFGPHFSPPLDAIWAAPPPLLAARIVYLVFISGD